MTVVYNLMHALGDSIFTRACVRELPAGTYIRTSYPELYQDLKLNIVLAESHLRTPGKNIQRNEGKWCQLPDDAELVEVRYGKKDIKNINVVRFLGGKLGVEPKVFDLPPLPESPFRGQKIAVVKPCTIRSEWPNPARNPDPNYIFQATKELKKAGFLTVGIADLEEGKEWLVEPVPKVDVRLYAGEYDILTMLSIVSEASAVVTGQGWAVAVGAAARVPTFVVGGGCLGSNSRKAILDESLIDSRRVIWVNPNPACNCFKYLHECNKTIPNFKGKFRKWLSTL